MRKSQEATPSSLGSTGCSGLLGRAVEGTAGAGVREAHSPSEQGAWVPWPHNPWGLLQSTRSW